MSLATLAPPALAPVVGAVAVAVLPRRAGHAVAAVAVAVVVPWVVALPAGTHLPVRLFGFDAVLLHVDGFSRAVGFAFGVAAVANVAYGFGSGATRRRTATALAYVAASLGAVLVGDWLTLVVCWELMAVAATVLVWQHPDAVRAGYRYAVYHQLGGALLVAGVLLHYTRTGTVVYADGVAAGLPALLALAGVLVNVGMVGVHVWLVDTYPRPHVATSVVLCAFTTKVGVYALVRVVPDGSVPLAYAGGGMLLVGVTLAVLQTDVRRLLTYHIVSQVGYMVAGVGVASALGGAGAMAHLVNNVLYKSLLFMVAGVLVLETGAESLKALHGAGRGMPRTAAAFAVAALAITGVPGFAGFVSKGMVLDSAAAAGLDLLWWSLVVGGVGTVVSFAKFGYYAFLHGAGDAPETGEATRAQTAAMALVALPCVAFGLAPDLLFAVLPPGTASAKVFAASQFEKAGAVALAGGVGFVVLRRPLSRLPDVPDLDAVYHPLGARLRDGTVAVVAGVAATADAATERTVARTVAVARDPGGVLGVGGSRTTVGDGLRLLALVTAAVVVLALV